MSEHVIGEEEYFAENWNYKCLWCKKYFYPSDNDECEVSQRQRVAVTVILGISAVSAIIVVGIFVL